MAKGLAKEEKTRYQTKVAGLLLLLSRGGVDDDDDDRMPAAPGSAAKMTAGSGAFECKTCSRRFPSFQALGGHRTSHGRGVHGGVNAPRHAGGGQRAGAAKKPKALRRHHKCSVCGLAFHMGQALGGHMRRHKLAEAAAGERTATWKDGPWLDLNLPPLDVDLQLG